MKEKTKNIEKVVDRTPCYAIFHGESGYPFQREEALQVFVPGKQYKIIGGEIGSSFTYLEIEGVEGQWNSVMFHYDEELLPVSNPYAKLVGYTQDELMFHYDEDLLPVRNPYARLDGYSQDEPCEKGCPTERLVEKRNNLYVEFPEYVPEPIKLIDEAATYGFCLNPVNGPRKLTPFEERIVIEKKELDEKIANLEQFLDNCSMFVGHAPSSKGVSFLFEQLSYMVSYSEVLGERLAWYEEESERLLGLFDAWGKDTDPT